jgi:signal transduction histidine kinase
MMRLLTIFSLLLIFAQVNNLHAESHEAITRGVLDLRAEAITAKYKVRLNGQWEFYWNKMLRPHHFSGPDSPVPDAFPRVPSYWTETVISGAKTTGKGFATYRLTILLPKGEKPPLGLDVKVMDSSYDLYVNGKFLGSNGVPGTDQNGTIPEYRPLIYRFTPTSDTVEIIFNVANFHHRRGGFWLPVEFGSFAKIQTDAAREFGRSIAIITVLLTFGTFFLFFFLIYPRDKVSIYFSLILFGLAIRAMVTNQMVIFNFFSPDWQWVIKLEYLSTDLLVIGAYWFLFSLFKSQYQRFFAIITTFVFSLIAIATLILDVAEFSRMALISYMFVAIFAVNSILCSGVRFYKRRSLIDGIYLFSLLLLVLAAVHDITIATVNIAGFGKYILSEAILVLIFIQTALLIYKWVASFLEKEKLRIELETLNRNLESMVQKRTRELIQAKNEAEDYSLQLGKQNQNLSETIQLKNRVFSVIAHDLRSPVVNILYILNLLKEEEYKEKYESLAGSCIHYSQMVINLLENMLVWGRGQEDSSIRYSPGFFDFTDLILTNMSIHKDTADRKNVSVSFTQIGGTKAWFDKDLLDIIIRNLLTNAIKYTNRGGRISILVKEKNKSSEEVMLRICDNGIGMDEVMVANLNESRVISSTPGTENEKGTGLGLKLVYDLVAINRGTIKLETKPGEGTCFSIMLPKTQEKAESK